jgi:hypothetical protein
MRTKLLIGALASLLAGFGFSAGLHYDKWIHVDRVHFIVGTSGRYVDAWHGSGDGGINIRLSDRTCVGHSLNDGFYVDKDC